MRAALALLLLVAAPAVAQLDISFDPHPGEHVPELEEYYGGPPIVLVLGYAGCVNLCGTTLHGVSEALHETKLVPELDYRALFVSVDPRDEKAPPERRPGWHFLTGAARAAKMAAAVGFRYRYDEDSGQFAHPAGFVVLTPQGRIARYFEGVRFDNVQLKDAIADARQGQVQTAWQRLVLVCFHDPLVGRHTPTVMMALRIAMALLIATAAFFAWRRLR
jgi:protein SCO1/2